MDMTDEQRRWWFATHPEYSWSRTRAGLSGRRPRAADFPGDANTALANERLRQALGHPAPAPNVWDKYAQSRAERELYRQAFEEPQPGLESDPHTALDVIPYARSLRAPVQALQNILKRIARNAVISNIKRTGERPPRLPQKGTPERAKIEAARSRGRDAKMREERADIKAGGEGSGVWKEKELEEIKQGGKFPPDSIWHHEPSVANRPDLAADPRAVHPLRGGRKGHLEDGHGKNWQNPYDPGVKAPWE